MLRCLPSMARFLFDTANNELSGVEILTIMFFGDVDGFVINKVNATIGRKQCLLSGRFGLQTRRSNFWKCGGAEKYTEAHRMRVV